MLWDMDGLQMEDAQILTGTDDGSIYGWDTATGKLSFCHCSWRCMIRLSVSLHDTLYSRPQTMYRDLDMDKTIEDQHYPMH